jgi:hypothetical protein
MYDLAAELVKLGANLEARTEDMTVPGGGAISGGRTPLHLAAVKGDTEMVKLLLEGGALVDALDYDKNSPLLLAAMEGRGGIVALLTVALKGCFCNTGNTAALQASKSLAMVQAKQRLAEGMNPEAKFKEVHKLRQVWTAKERAKVLEVVNRVVSKIGWQKNRHAAYATTDMRCSDLPMAAAVWVRRTISERLFPVMLKCYDLRHHQLSFRDLFFVYYKAAPGHQSELSIHRDGSLLSFNILLNNRTDFEGGGTFIQETGATHHIHGGDALMHSGQVLHGGATVTSGERYLLVGFVNVMSTR